MFFGWNERSYDDRTLDTTTLRHLFNQRPNAHVSVNVICLPIRNYKYKSMHGLSESQIKRHLEKYGWRLWRGGFLREEWHQDSPHPVVRRSYTELLTLLQLTHPPQDLAFLYSFPAGMPDYLAYNPSLKQFKFIECKLGHETLSQRQRETFTLLEEHGFIVEVWKLVYPCTKTRRGRWEMIERGNAQVGRITVRERDAKLTKKLFDSNKLNRTRAPSPKTALPHTTDTMPPTPTLPSA